jgi:hypothetical protein
MVVAFVVSLVYFTGIVFAKVSKRMNLMGAATSFLQSILFIIFFGGGNWLSSYIVDYDTWNVASIAALISFVVTIICIFSQVPGKIFLAKMSAWSPYFFEASMAVPTHKRVAFARKVAATPRAPNPYRE